jgi:hypothetical protein
VEKAAISGADRILVSDGAAYPKTITEVAGPPITFVERRWGVIPPTTILQYGLDHGTAGEGVQDTVSYIYTLVTSYGEESAPFTPSAAIDIPVGQYIGLKGWCVYAGSTSADWQTTTGNQISYIRVYRLVSTASGDAEYQRVSLWDGVAGHDAVAEIPVASITGVNMEWLDTNSTHTGLSESLGAMAQTEGWDPPPVGMKGACMFTNGMYAGFVGKTVYLSVPGYYYAFPASGTMDYTMELPYTIVGLAAFNESLVVGTTGFPEVISGADAAYMSRATLPYQQPCLSGKGMVSLPDGVAYVSPDGLFFVTSGGGEILTKNVMDRDDWQAYPLASAICVYHNQRIYILFEGYNYGLIYDRDLDYMVRIEPGMTIYDAWADPVADVLYLAGSSGIYAWEGHSTAYLTATWKSGIMETPPVNFAAMRVEGILPSGHTTALTYYVDGVLKHTQSITDDNPFRLPSGFRGRDHEITITFSKSTIDALYVSSDIGDLKNV